MLWKLIFQPYLFDLLLLYEWRLESHCYVSAAISSLLNDWSGMDMEETKEYIVNCQSYDGGFWLVPGLESHVMKVVQHILQS
ncbi:geranylgeranyl transferase type-1 subunit beta-like [Papaver somniferum]|uniref:geranylgeranyl transferase type-1 subunit beta-like n=1 Tax=Papaver somniferum TaxID=3469 RepID=UPI000E705A1A|nr:geranylgeranyl transferase type-1 subunit beta-like [Papaver somniferum]